VLSLFDIDSSVEIISDGMINHKMSYDECLHQGISHGSRGAKSLILLRTLFDTSPAVAEYDDSGIFHLACAFLKGELNISVLSLLLSKNDAGVRVVNNRNLPIHFAALHSCLEAAKFLHKAYPESISILGNNENSLLNFAACEHTSDIADVIGKVQYLCNQCPALIHLKYNKGITALHNMHASTTRLKFECVRILCEMDWTVLKDKCTPSNLTRPHSGQLPLHLLIERRSKYQIKGIAFAFFYVFIQPQLLSKMTI
jgi:hypothetical protein